MKSAAVVVMGVALLISMTSVVILQFGNSNKRSKRTETYLRTLVIASSIVGLASVVVVFSAG